MSMDLAKKTYSTTPDYFIAGTTVGIVTAAKEASAAIAAHNLVLLDGGKVKPLAAVDGSNALNVTGLYGIAAEDAASGEDAVVYLTGEFFADGLALPDGVAAADIEVALRNIGMVMGYMNVDSNTENHIMRLEKPYYFEGKQYTEIDLNGVADLNSLNESAAENRLTRAGFMVTDTSYNYLYACILAGMATGLPEEFFTGLPLYEVLKIKNAVNDAGFFE